MNSLPTAFVNDPNSGTPDKGRRQFERYECAIPVRLQIMIPEKGFEPHEIEALSKDVSAGGMKVGVEALETEVYTKLLLKTRDVAVEFEHSGQLVQVTGSIAWIDFHKRNAGEKSGLCNLGISIQKPDGDEIASYMAFLQSFRTA